MDGRWIGGPPGGPAGGPPRASLQQKPQPPPQPSKDRESLRDSKSSAASSAPSAAFGSKGGLQGPPPGGPHGAAAGGSRGGQATTTKKSTAATLVAEVAPALKSRVVSGSATSSSNSSGSARQQLPLQTEEEFLRGCGFQAIWGESFEVSGLMSAAVKLSKLAPTEGDEEWQEAHLAFLHMLHLCRARLGRHHCLLQSRLQDVQDVLEMEEEIQACTAQYKDGIAIARGELEVAQQMSARRRELDLICSEVLKKPCLRETTQLESREAALRIKAENFTEEILSKIARKKQLAEAATKAGAELFENVTPGQTAN
ncbi:hypothetical protein Esti_003487 [Eimeria stiedai]